ncbi:3D-(3,5/4)-trihydroxycyclohexane-1,2-dione acylhydrolase (decyclizing) [Pseudovibrio japonicus]|uniref:3D-(3,5/4)-trihydroxycyclohexane-1,2-dione acylhydrolase (Decyclizing) n=1 Tax=Pseudovibrio japonicus TaxID=366534 RepID=A0ABQ3DYY9_9HYPH|nr:3D-(3,5/4)-trihydroxycyclohexane-1,2-dione acylhydrolase (decyclizing) [Pseudovibrio japonicus]GHB20244.1 3D-(3,5/4)-trihydroxycyclohexane-1,2-dione acylhydrolase (decyclizing) [Pseudovibrio japonicus]
MSTIRLTAAQALVRYLAAQKTPEGDSFIAGVWAIFGHGNVAGLGEALYHAQDTLPTYRGHNEQGMAHAAIAYAKASNRRRAMAVTSSIGPGATNMVTAAALAHVNRLPVLLLPGDVFSTRAPDPVLQQVEDFQDGTVSVNDTFRPVSRYFDRIQRPEQLLTALPRAMAVLTDPVECGPVTLAMCQDVQAEAYDWPVSFFKERTLHFRRPAPDADELATAVAAIQAAKKPMIIAGGGVHYSLATDELKSFAEAHNVPVAETQAGKSALPWDHELNLGSVGVTGSSAANAVAEEADLIIAVGTRLQDFTTGSWALFKNPERRILQLNAASYDSGKHNALPLVCDARVGLQALTQKLGGWKAATDGASFRAEWLSALDKATAAPEGGNELPTDAQVIGAVQRASDADTTVVCAAGGLPGELHKLWKTDKPGGYHLEYGYSCMGYEIAGGLGVKMAKPDSEVIVMVGDGSYMMMNSELATSVMMGQKIIVVLLDNRGFGCINRLQMATGGDNFNNLLDDAYHTEPSQIDFAAHAGAMGATSEHVSSIEELGEALERAKASSKSYCVVIDTDPLPSTEAGGHWWDVAVPEVSSRKEVNEARKGYENALADQRLGD